MLQRLLGTDADKVVVNSVFVQIIECKIGKLSRYGLPIRQRRQIGLTFYNGVPDLEILPVPGFRNNLIGRKLYIHPLFQIQMILVLIPDNV